MSNNDKKGNEDYIQIIVRTGMNRLDPDYFKDIAKVVHELPMINGYVLELPKSALNKLGHYSAIEEVEYDEEVSAQMDISRQNINVERMLQRGPLSGRGVTVAVLDTGIYPHGDFLRPHNRLVHQEDMVNDQEDFYDDSGHGTHVAGIIASSGFNSDGRYMGVAPGAHLVSVKVLDKSGRGKMSNVLAGLQWIYDNYKRYHIRVVNVSVGMTDAKGEDGILVKAVNQLWDEGLVVVTAAGNKGPNSRTILSPGISRKVITVGCSNDNQTVEIDGEFRINYSSRGPTMACIVKPDVLAPGGNIISCLSNTAYECGEKIDMKDCRYGSKSGTSMSTPMVSGAIALYLQSYPEATPNEVKEALSQSCDDLGLHPNRQGWGLLNVERFIRSNKNEQDRNRRR